MSKSSEALKLVDAGHTVQQAANVVGTAPQNVYAAIHRRKMKQRNFKPVTHCPTCHQLLPVMDAAAAGDE